MSEKIFPTDYTDEEISVELRSLLKKVKDAQFNINTVLQYRP